jgi:response regulator RpfG family c-di-GMP phosphodiesterase
MVFLSNNYQEGIMLALIVDECDELRMWLSVLLATVGYSVQNAKNGLDAFDLGPFFGAFETSRLRNLS